MKNIEFNKAFDHAGITGHSPSTATKSLPTWFKKIPKYIENAYKPTFDGQGRPDLTIKSCPPFLDSITSGYVIYTEFDMLVSWDGDNPYFEWKHGGELISSHSKQQISLEQIPEGFSEEPLKFNNLWQIKTPSGYSTLFTHPFNRTDLPFLTISGVVETDTYKHIINFPFLIKKDFEGIIPAGTPIVQLLPFKRESWQMNFGEVSQKELDQELAKLNHRFIGGYKTQWWRRKEYR